MLSKTNHLIVEHVWDLVLGNAKVEFQNEPGYCLAVVRQTLEDALDLPSWSFYQRYITSWVAPKNYPHSEGHWARDFEHDAKRLGWAVKTAERQPGDVVFNYKAAYSQHWSTTIGHVGILVEHNLVFENINPAYRPHSFIRGALALTDFDTWPCTLVARVPESIIS